MHQPQRNTFEVETLKLASEPLETLSTSDIYQTISNNHVLASDNHHNHLVNFHSNSFLGGLHAAYSEHRPFVLSPDIIWLLISQGFAQHVNYNSNQLRRFFVQHQGKKILKIETSIDILEHNSSKWQEVIQLFCDQIGSNVGKELTNTLTADFSTTTIASKVASQITIMEAMKAYFEYEVGAWTCGIPSITIEGTKEDWEKIIVKTKALAKYKLSWWTQKLLPILNEFVKAAEFKENPFFWRDMYKYHEAEFCNASPYVTGWISNFFPYDKKGNKTPSYGLKLEDMPEEISRVDATLIINNRKHPIQLVAGFVGLSQDPKTLALRPEIGWMIQKEGTHFMEPVDYPEELGIELQQIKTIPEYFFEQRSWAVAKFSFEGKVQIPTKIKTLYIDFMKVEGNISLFDKLRLRRLLPYTKLVINNEVWGPYGQPKDRFRRRLSQTLRFLLRIE